MSWLPMQVKYRVSPIRQGDVHVYKGIPFAAPPVGELRWIAIIVSQHINA